MDPATRMLFNSVAVAILSIGLAWLSARYWYTRKAVDIAAANIAKATEKLTQRVNELESEHALVKASVVPITTAFQQLLIQKLTHYHEPETDRLLEKAQSDTLTESETDRLHALLIVRTRDMGDEITEFERRAAKILPDVIFMAKEVQEELSRESTLAVVAVPKILKNGLIGNSETAVYSEEQKKLGEEIEGE